MEKKLTLLWCSERKLSTFKLVVKNKTDLVRPVHIIGFSIITHPTHSPAEITWQHYREDIVIAYGNFYVSGFLTSISKFLRRSTIGQVYFHNWIDKNLGQCDYIDLCPLPYWLKWCP